MKINDENRNSRAELDDGRVKELVMREATGASGVDISLRLSLDCNTTFPKKTLSYLVTQVTYKYLLIVIFVIHMVLNGKA